MTPPLANAAKARRPRRRQRRTRACGFREVYRAAFVLFVAIVCPVGRTDAGEAITYNRDIRPILAENCFACHGADEKANDSGLRLDLREEAIDYGAIAPGDLDASLLITTILSDDPAYVMPPPRSHKKLTPDQKQKLKAWVAQGAEYQGHWAFTVPRKAEPPRVKRADWPRNAIDNFILARLEEAGFEPAPEADARTLFRRVHFDCTGLPPDPADADAFEADYNARGDLALSEWIDRLMATPAWGEHRGRYWLDAARYGDTHGLHFDNYREMWPYRDWVIRAFNANQPFDEFAIEQLAGDLLPDPTDDQLIATGFQRCNITTNEGGTIDEENEAVYAADRVQTFGWVFLGLTTNCAQCHDHKFDPITMKDYYALAAFFRNTESPAKDGNVKGGRGPTMVVPSAADRPRWKELPGEIAAAESRLQQRRDEARPAFDAWLAQARPADLEAGPLSEQVDTHLPLEEGPGATLAAAGAAADQVVTSGKLKWVGGKAGKAPVVRPGTPISVPGAGDFGAGQPFSCGAWVKVDSAGADAAILSRMDAKQSSRGWDVMQSGHTFAVRIAHRWPQDAVKVVVKGRPVQVGQWQHVFVTYDGSRRAEGLKIYVDGQAKPTRIEKDSLTAAASIRADAPLAVGRRHKGAVLSGAAIQDVRAYRRRLLPSEVASLAGLADLRDALALPAEKREPAQVTALFGHYLAALDEPHRTLTVAWSGLVGEQEAIRKRSPITHIQKEKSQPAMAHLLMRGQYDQKGDRVAAAPPDALHPMPEGSPANRLGLAQWAVAPDNPLMPRVTVNRFWQEVFGRGIVPSAGDLGVSGALPSHPELLDWLASDFRDTGWDVRRVFKTMLMSSTYRQSAVATPAEVEADPPNALLARGPRFRMDAEMVRDAALASSGLLARRMFGPGARPYQPIDIWNMVGLPNGDTRNYVQDTGDNLYRRSVYTFWKRMSPPPSLEAFNAPSREVCVVARERTNTPLQALVTLNDPQFVEAARRLAEEALRGADERAVRVNFAARRLLARPLSDREAAIVLASLARYAGHYASNPDDAEALIAVGDSAADGALDPASLAAWTMVCSELMNLDEAICK
ncbi:MAG: DUF1553 domain-containing protein [Planctomycetota bacterium]